MVDMVDNCDMVILVDMRIWSIYLYQTKMILFGIRIKVETLNQFKNNNFFIVKKDTKTILLKYI